MEDCKFTLSSWNLRILEKNNEKSSWKNNNKAAWKNNTISAWKNKGISAWKIASLRYPRGICVSRERITTMLVEE
eukprot:16230525-Heterocapsa_arctica.AAC.1